MNSTATRPPGPAGPRAADLRELLADMRGEAAVLRKHGARFSLERVEQFCDDVAAATEEWTTFLSEKDAAIRSGWSEAWLRARFEELRRAGHAKLVGHSRQYRACAVPRRANVTAAAAKGRDAARATRNERKAS